MRDTLPNRVRLGPIEVDFRLGELCEGERSVMLQGQSLFILRMLVERDGELVTREEIRKKLWPNDTVVEFDHSINTAMKKLRRALGDSPDEPKYVETIPRRGYRMLVPVEWVTAADYAREISVQDVDRAGAPSQLQHESAVLTGRTVSHYRVLDIIGGGGMGVVYRAEDLKLGRRVALKFLPEELGSDPQALERFSREARAASSLDHPNICPIHEFGEHDGRPFIAMQLLEGQTLRDRLAAGGANEKALPLGELLEIGILVSDGLQAAHETGIIHRDVKPANIFLTSKGGCKILDFGLVKLLEGGDEDEIEVQPEAVASASASGAMHLTRTGAAMGTAGYMSPEQVRGEKLDARSDIFSLGLVLYEMATGQCAFTGETAAMVQDAIANHDPKPVRELAPQVSPKLDAIIGKCLNKDRERRWQSAMELRTELEQVRRAIQSSRLRKLVRRLRLSIMTVCAFLAVVGAGLYWHSHHTPKLTDQDTIVLADFKNNTSDAVFDDSLAPALQLALAQTPFLNLLGADKIRGTLKLMNHPEDEKLSADTARTVCSRTNSKAFVTGSITDAGSHYHLRLECVDCQTGNTLAKSNVEVKNRDETVRQLGAAAVLLRKALGEPTASLRKFDQPLDNATSPSPEALQALILGSKVSSKSGDGQAIPYYKRALDFDPKFAMAYLNLSGAYGNLGRWDLAIQAEKQGFELRHRLTERQRLFFEAHYQHQVMGDLNKAVDIWLELIRTYPNSASGHLNLGGLYIETGEYEKAIAELEKARRFAPDNFETLHLLVWSYFGANRFQEARDLLDWMEQRDPHAPALHRERYIAAFLACDYPAMKEQVRWAADASPSEGLLIPEQAGVESYFGRLAKARDLARRAVALAMQKNAKDIAADQLAEGALLEAEIGETTKARQTAEEAVAIFPGRDVRVMAAWALARSGETSRAEDLTKTISKEFQLDASVRNYSLPTMQAASQLRANPGRTVDLLRSTMPYDLGHAPGSLPNLYHIYLRGLAYMQSREPEQAAQEFQTIIDHSGVVYYFIVGALAHLQLGRAQAMMGDKLAARKSYDDFLTLWRDADSDVPIYKQAKAEYARLR